MKNRREQGFTIIEMVALLVMTTTALLFLYHITSLTLESKRLQIVARELGRDTSETCFRFSQESRTVRSNIDLLIATNNEVRFINTTGTTIRYWLSGNNLMRNNQILLDQMNALNFTYYDENGTQIANPTINPASTNVRSVRMNLTVQREGKNLSMMSEAQLRNVK